MGRGISGWRLVGVHVLVVDDNADARDLFRAILQYAGALVSVAESAEQALAVLDRVVPNVILTDIAMPERDGYWLIERLRAREVKAGGVVPVIAVTAHAERRPSHFPAAGFQGYLRKPIDPEELCRLVDTLGRRRA